jgi:DNA-binding transcriptional LysR family regulator
MALPGKIDLNDLLVFEAVAETGGFTAAAERLGVATAKVSVEIGRLESKLGVALFSRTTRKVVLTDAGQTLYGECRPLLHGLTEAIERAGSGKEKLAGYASYKQHGRPCYVIACARTSCVCTASPSSRR